MLRIATCLALAACILPAAGVTYTITTFAGGTHAGDGGAARSASLGSPEGLAIDRAGNLYIADALDHRIRKVAPDGRISTLAGAGMPGFSGDGGAADRAELNQPYGIAVDAAGNVYVADLGNGRVRRIGPDGVITTVAGGGAVEGADGVAGTSARLLQPRDVALDAAGNLYISDFAGHRVYRLSRSGIVFVVAGTGKKGTAPVTQPVVARDWPLAGPAGLAADAAGRLYIADSENGVIRVIENGKTSAVPESVWDIGKTTAIAVDSAGIVYAASKFGGAVFRLNGQARAVLARPAVFEPRSMCFGPDGSLYIGDILPGQQTAGVVRKLSRDVLSTVAGNGTFRPAGDGLQPSMAHFREPAGVAVDALGTVYITDAGDGRLRKVRDGVINTVAGSLNAPRAVTVDAAGAIWLAERGAKRFLKLSAAGDVLASVPSPAPEAVAAAANGTVYLADSAEGYIYEVTPVGVVSNLARIDHPSGVAVNAEGVLFVSAPDGIYKLGAAGSLAMFAAIEKPGRLAVDGDGALIVADPERHRVLRVGKDGTAAVIAGSGIAGFRGDDGPAASALLNGPADVAVGPAGEIYIADSRNLRVRKLTADAPHPPPPVEVFAVVNAASMEPGPIAPGSLVTLFGNGIGPAEAAYGSLGTSLEGFEVLFDGRPAPLLYAQSNQVNLQAPYSIAGRGTTQIEIRENGVRIFGLAAPVADSAPGLFMVAGARNAAALNEDGSINSAENPAPRGSIVSLWATGEGQTDPPGVEGIPATVPLPEPVLPVSVVIGGEPADVLYAGAAPGFAGLMQVNVRVPASVERGARAVELLVGTARSQAGVTIAVR